MRLPGPHHEANSVKSMLARSARCLRWVKMRNTHAEQNRSALTLTADVWVDTDFRRQQRTYALQQLLALFLDHFVRAGEDRLRHGEPQRLRCFEVYGQLISGRPLHWQVGRLLPFENAINIAGCTSVLIDRIGTIRNETAVSGVGAVGISRR